MQNKSAIPTFILIFTMMTISLIGCASYHARKQAMVADSFQMSNKHAHSINVSVIGGDSASRLKSTLTSEEYEEALKISLINSNAFSEVVNNINANYFLNVNIINVGYPPPGADMRVTVVTNWKLSSTPTGTNIWQEIISSSHTATVADAFGGVNRVRIAIEGAAKKNIQKGIEKLSTLEF